MSTKTTYYSLEQFAADLAKIPADSNIDAYVDEFRRIVFTESKQEVNYVKKTDNWNTVKLSKGKERTCGDLLKEIQELATINPKAGVDYVGEIIMGLQSKVIIKAHSGLLYKDTSLNTTVSSTTMVALANEKKIMTLVDLTKLLESQGSPKLTRPLVFIGDTWYASESDVLEAYPRLTKLPDPTILYKIHQVGTVTVHWCLLSKGVMTKKFGPKVVSDQEKLKKLLEAIPPTDEAGRTVTTTQSEGLKMIRRTLPNGDLDGLQETFYSNGKLYMTTPYQKGQIHGTFMMYDEKGNVDTKKEYVNGKRHGPFEQYHRGVPVQKGSYKDDNQDGLWEFYAKGKLYARGSYVDGWLDGIYEEVDQDGKVVLRRVYQNRDGTQIYPLLLVPVEGKEGQFLLCDTSLHIEKLSTGIHIVIGRSDGTPLTDADRAIVKKFDLKMIEA